MKHTDQNYLPFLR